MSRSRSIGRNEGCNPGTAPFVDERRTARPDFLAERAASPRMATSGDPAYLAWEPVRAVRSRHGRRTELSVRTETGGDLYLAVNDFARSTGWLHGPVTAYAKYGLLVFAGLLAVGWWVSRPRPSARMAAALLAPVATVLAIAVNQPLIRHVAEARPYAVHPLSLIHI